jgi:flagellar biosynthetic protein FliP
MIPLSPASRFRAATVILCVFCAALVPGPALAQEVTFDLGGDSLSGRAIQLIALITVLSLAPGLAVMITCFPFVVTVLSILRQALGLQQAPPNMLIVSLALFPDLFRDGAGFRGCLCAGIEPLTTGTSLPKRRYRRPMRHSEPSC